MRVSERECRVAAICSALITSRRKKIGGLCTPRTCSPLNAVSDQGFGGRCCTNSKESRGLEWRRGFERLPRSRVAQGWQLEPQERQQGWQRPGGVLLLWRRAAGELVHEVGDTVNFPDAHTQGHLRQTFCQEEEHRV